MLDTLSFLKKVWSVQPDGFGFVSLRAEPTSWRDTAIKRPSQRIVLPEPNEGDIYFTPNLFRRPRRRRELMLPSRWLYADLDSVDPIDIEEKFSPTVAWESSPQRYQALWLLPAPLPPDDHQLLNKRLTYHLDADRGGWDAPQVLRLPGTQNHKYPNDPSVLLLWYFDEPFHASDELPSVARSRQGVAKFKVPDLTARQIMRARDGSISAGVRGKLRAQQAVGDRSRVLYRLTMTLLQKGVPPGEVFVLLKGTVWNKFDERGLREDIGRAYARVQS